MESPQLDVLSSSPVPGNRPSKRHRLPMLFFLLLFLLGILTIPWLAEHIVFAMTRGQERAKAEIARKLLDDLPQPEQRIAWVAKSAGPSVVGIQTLAARGLEMGVGSGIIVDADGFIVTNHHVIANVRSISIQLSDGRTFNRAYLVGLDPTMDLAVLKINATDLTSMPWGDSNTLEIGDAVVAIGNPFGLEHTVTSGIISAKERFNNPMSGPVYFQTDAAINQGNSGGPLVNLRGELIGVNTAIIGESFQGVGFAIPSNMVKRVYEKIRKYGKVEHGWLGIAMKPPTGMELEKQIGVVVVGFQTPSPAQDAGIIIGDIILRWNGEEIRDRLHLMQTILFSNPNTKAKVEILRDGQKIELEVVLGKRPITLQ